MAVDPEEADGYQRPRLRQRTDAHDASGTAAPCRAGGAPADAAQVAAQQQRVLRNTYLLLALSLTGCDIFDKKKTPLPGERTPVFSDRKDLVPDKETAGVQVELPAPVANDSWPQSGGFANYAMHNLAIGPSPQIIWTAALAVRI